MATTSNVPRIAPPQAFITSYAPRLRAYANALITPIAPAPTVLPPVRTTKRGTTAINYAEDGYGSDFDEDTDGISRRPTGLRSQRDDGARTTGGDRAGAGGSSVVGQQGAQYGKEARGPVNVQGIWRDWIGKQRPPLPTEKQAQTQCLLPLHLIPIRIDVDVAPFRPDAPLPTPPGTHLNEMLAAYRPGELTPGFRIKDAFLWNLHEALLTPEQFAQVFLEEIDLPPSQRGQLKSEIARQIRDQLESNAGTALHPLFEVPEKKSIPQQQHSHTVHVSNGISSSVNGTTPLPASGNGVPYAQTVTATATHNLHTSSVHPTSIDPTINPPDTHRCILTLSIPHGDSLYTDRLEWSLLHPPGAAETFARLTTADLGLPAEYTPQIAHAIYEAVLRLQKEAAENAASTTANGSAQQGNALLFSTGDALTHAGAGLAVRGSLGLDNDAAREEGAGWRYDPEHVGYEWAPKIEVLSKEEIEKREGDRERRLRRARRETARMAGNAAGDSYGDGYAGGGGGRSRGRELGGLGVGLGDGYTPAGNRGSAFGTPDVEDPDAQMGRGHRSKKKRRYRSLSPEAPDGAAAQAATNSGPTAGIGVLTEAERSRFRCAHCALPGSGVWAVRDGPEGKDSLCQVCGLLWERCRNFGVDGEEGRMWRGNEGFFANEAVMVGRR